MATILNKLQRASYNGVQFLAITTSSDSGRKQVIHEFPQSNKRNVEDLGLLNRTHSITGMLTGTDYLVRRNSLQAELERGGIGVLQHPFYGRLNVVPLPYTITQDLRQAGAATFEMKFSESVSQAQPQAGAVGTNSQIFNQNQTTNNAFNNAFSAGSTGFNISKNFIGNFRDGVAQIDSVIAFFKGAPDTIGRTGDITEYNRTLEEFESNKFSLLEDPTALSASIDDLYNKAIELSDDPAINYSFLKTGFEFETQGTFLTIDTASVRERNANKKHMTDLMRGLALSNGFQQASLITFDNEDDMQTVRDELDQGFTDMINAAVDPTARDEMERLRTLVNTVFNENDITIFKTTTINVNTQPVAIIAFNEYGNTDEEKDLITLNNVYDPSFVMGDFVILTE